MTFVVLELHVLLFYFQYVPVCMCPVDCMSSPTSTTTSPEVSTSYKNGDVRLANGNTDHEGYVQVYSDGSWGHICHNKWQTPEAIVVCRQLGFPVIGKAVLFHCTKYLCSHFDKVPNQPVALSLVTLL